MNWSLILVFTLVTMANVLIHTCTNIVTVKCNNPHIAGLVNAVNEVVYLLVIIYTNCDLPIAIKLIIGGLAYYIGVVIVKSIENKARKDKLWKIEAYIRWNELDVECIKQTCAEMEIPYYYQHIGDYAVLTFFTKTQKESASAKELCGYYRAKFFASESKML